MKQEIAKKYLKEIEYFANGGELLYKLNKDSKWCDVKEPSFDNPNTIYIKNDEYIELRKAFHAGKTIEYLINNKFEHTQWMPFDNINDNINFEGISLSHLRIKPEFKVNDFVISPDGDIEQIYSLREINGRLFAQFSEVQEDGTDDISEWKVWQPEIGKYNLFRNADSNYVLAKLIDVKDGLYRIQKNPFNKFNGYEYYEECYPFMAKLPKTLSQD